MPRAALLPIVLAVILVSAPAGAQDRSTGAGAARLAIIEAEAARAAAPEQLQLLVRTAAAPSALQPLAIRALGRLERADLIDTLLPLLDAVQPAARAEAAWALPQSAGSNAEVAATVRDLLLQRLVGESDADVRGAIGEALGRLPLESPAVAGRIEETIVAIVSRLEVTSRIDKQAAGGRIVGLTLTPTRAALVPLPALIGGLRGLEALSRAKARARQPLMPDTIARLRILATDDPATSDARNRSGSRQADAARARRLALLCLLPAGGVNTELVTRLLGDSDAQVRRLAVSAAGADRAAIGRGLKDTAWLVRHEALRAYGRRFQASEGCAPIVDVIRNQTDHVSLLAVDLLGGSCQPDDKAVERLIDLALQVSPEVEASLGAEALAKATDWLRPAHAILALAKAAPERARPYIARFLRSGPWQSRIYGARAAAQAGDVEMLKRFAADADDNVREAAIAGLSNTARTRPMPSSHRAGREGFPVGDDRGLRPRGIAGPCRRGARAPVGVGPPDRARRRPVQGSADGHPRAGAGTRFGRPRRRADAVPDRRHPKVAGLAATVLSKWTGTTVAAAPRRRPAALPPLTAETLQRLAKTIVRVTMAGGDSSRSSRWSNSRRSRARCSWTVPRAATTPA